MAREQEITRVLGSLAGVSRALDSLAGVGCMMAACKVQMLGDIIGKYTSDEARNLWTFGELPEDVRINETYVGDVEVSYVGVVFDASGGVNLDDF